VTGVQTCALPIYQSGWGCGFGFSACSRKFDDTGDEKDGFCNLRADSVLLCIYQYRGEVFGVTSTGVKCLAWRKHAVQSCGGENTLNLQSCGGAELGHGGTRT